MEPATTLPILLMWAWLLPLISFVLILFFGKHMGSHGKFAGHLATGAIVAAGVLSFVALFGVGLHPLTEAAHSAGQPQAEVSQHQHALSYAGDWYTLATFGKLKLSIGYYIDGLTVVMFCMVAFIASCVHFYAMGYMHDELHDFTDPEVKLASGQPLQRAGRYYRFFQYLSLFCFSMLGLVLAGNLAMVFVFWELVGICSYFLIGFYIERHTASTAANKAFIVNRVGDFGMLIGLMALWSSLGTLSFGDTPAAGNTPATSHSLATARAAAEQEPGIFSLLRTAENNYQLQPTASMVAEGLRIAPATAAGQDPHPGHWLLLVAGVGLFCGCVGKSAQFPLHVWLPDAMEGPTPVSALVHSATMVAAGVYLVGRCFPIFSPEVLLVIAYVGCLTLVIAATIAITATDIKRVLAYSTVSQLGYMMLALGLGGWVAGMFHLITHACFKSLLFLCSGSVIHSVQTNDMTEMGGLRQKMPVTAYTMLIGCLAIIGAGIPLTSLGLSGYYSKDAILEQAFSFGAHNPSHVILQWAPVAGAMLTAIYMFRLWYLTFAGQPRDPHRYSQAHESPRVMTMPLLLLAACAVGIGWGVPQTSLSVTHLLEQARPLGTRPTTQGVLLPALVIPDEHLSHAREIKQPAGLAAFTTAALGLLLATVIYLWKWLDPAALRQRLQPLHSFLWHKWWFDELYQAVFVAPCLLLARWISKIDLGLIDGVIHGTAAACQGGSRIVDAVLDRKLVDGTANGLARGTWDIGLGLRKLQTGKLRQYVMLLVISTVMLFAAASYLPHIIP